MDEEALAWLWCFFGRKGSHYLVDVGAGNGESGSLSRGFLTEREWKGLLIDPLPLHVKALKKLYERNPLVKVLDCAVMPCSGSGPLWPFREVSTTRLAWAKACEGWWKHVNYSPALKVVYRKLDDILEEEEAPLIVDFLKLDTEGRDLEILKSLQGDRIFRVICVEVLDMVHRPESGGWKPSEDLLSFMEVKGYSLELVTKAGNAIFQRREG